MTSPAQRSIPATVARLRAAFDSGVTRPEKWRRAQLAALGQLLKVEKQAILEALASDISKCGFEAYTSEIAMVNSDIEMAERNLAKWMKPENASMPFLAGIGAKTKIVHEPLGVALIIGAWNYPIMLTLGPLIGAIAAGNAALIKPSELVPNCANVVQDAMARHLDPDAFAVIQGGIPETTEILAQRFDHIFFTGSPPVGRIVMRAAAEHLTPVVLELGGKSPAILCADADFDTSVKRITWGKFFNAGQTCIGVDHALVHESRYEDFLARATSVIGEFYGSDPKNSPDFARIVNEANVDRIAGLIEGQNVVTGGDVDREQRYIAPTVLRDVAPDSPVMQEEIFGPVLPVLPFSDLDQAVALVNSGPKPLASYFFTADEKTGQQLVRAISSGGTCINDTLTHITVGSAPFGGVGNSGMGSYHGYDGYLTFTHRRTVLTRSTGFDPSMRYPPYTDTKTRVASLIV